MQYSAVEFICFLLQSGGFRPLDSRILSVSWLSVRGFAEANVRCGTVLPWPETSFLPMSGCRSDRRCLDPIAQRTLFSLSVPCSCCKRVERHEGNDAFDRFFRSGAWVLFCALLGRDEGASMSRPRARPFFYSSVAPIRWGKGGAV